MPFVILPTNSASGGYDITNSLRFNAGSTDYLNRTPSSTTNRRTHTQSFWVKRSDLSRLQWFSSTRDYGTSNFFSECLFYGDDTFSVQLRDSVSNEVGNLRTTQLFRDISAWYHIVIAIDTTQATNTNRMKLYVNGSQVTALGTATYPSQNFDTGANVNGYPFYIGKDASVATAYNFNGYISEFNFIDGQALTPTSFGETDEDTGIWKPKAFSGTYGTNGFYLQFKNSASLGTDSSGNGNNFTVNNLTSVDQSTDTPTNNFATINALENSYSGLTLSEGNLKGVTTNAYYSLIRSTIGVSTGKWYMEAKCTAQSASENKWQFGISDFPPTSSSSYLGSASYSYGWRGEANTIFYNGTSTSYGTEGGMSTGMIVGIALDLDNNKIYWSRNGTWKNSANPATNTNGFSITGASSTNTGFYHFAFGELDGDYNYTYEVNFGNPPYSANSYTDGAGFGNFSYAVPSGYYALNTKNLATFG